MGAHHAEEMDDYLAMKPALIVWIEGDPAHIPVIEAAIAARAHLPTRQLVIQALITDRDDADIEFHRFSNQGHSSSIFHGTSLLKDTWPTLSETGETLKLRSWRLESVLAANSISPAQIDVMVCDLQGAELLALTGAGAFLHAAKFLEVEVSTKEFYAGGAQAAELDSFLEGQDFLRLTGTVWHGSAIYRKRIAELSKFETQDIALGKPATQSSTSPYSHGTMEQDARRAVAETWPADFSFCTEREVNPWWQVDLQGRFAIDEIYILNRLEAVRRLTYFTLFKSVDGMAWDVMYRKTDDVAPSNAHDLSYQVPIRPGEHVARFIRLRLDGEEYLHFRKFQVFGRKVA
jgi:hypothetical protein